MHSLLLFYTLPVACIGLLCRYTWQRLLAFGVYYVVMFFVLVVPYSFMGTIMLGVASFWPTLLALLAGMLARGSRIGGALTMSVTGSALLWFILMRGLGR